MPPNSPTRGSNPLRPLIAASFVATVAACSATQGPADETETLAAVDGFQNALVCSTTALPPLFGKTTVEVENYDTDLLNQRLAETPELREATGLTRVDGCRDARTVVAAYNALVDAETVNPVSDIVEDGRAPVAGLDEPVAIQRKIWTGTPVNDARILKIWTPNKVGSTGDVTNGRGGSCSAIAISPRHILTAAHCLPPGSANKNWRFQIGGTLPNASTVGQENVYGVYRAFVYRHGGYSGTSDTGDDVALLSVYKRCTTNSAIDGISSCTGSTWNHGSRMRVWAGSNHTGKPMTIRGWGSNSRYSQQGGVLREGRGGARIFIDWVGSKHFLTDDEKTAVICKGDSGGPAMIRGKHDYVAGLASNIVTFRDQVCTRTTGGSKWKKQRWHRVSGQFTSFVEPKLGGNSNFTCPSNRSGECCERDTDNTVGYSNGTFARCW